MNLNSHRDVYQEANTYTDTKINQIYTKLINGETNHFSGDGLNSIDFAISNSGNTYIDYDIDYILIYSSGGTGNLDLTMNNNRVKNYLMSTKLLYDRGSVTGENATFTLYANRSIVVANYYRFDFLFSDGVCSSFNILKQKDQTQTTIKSIGIKDINGDSMSLGTLTEYKIDIVSDESGTIDLYIDGVLQKENATDEHTLDSLEFKWGTSGISCDFGNDGLYFKFRHINLYQKNEVITL